MAQASVVGGFSVGPDTGSTDHVSPYSGDTASGWAFRWFLIALAWLVFVFVLTGEKG